MDGNPACASTTAPESLGATKVSSATPPDNLKPHLIELLDQARAALPPDKWAVLRAALEGTDNKLLTRSLNQLHSPHLDHLWNDWSTLGFAYEFLGRPNRRAAQNAVQKPDKSLDASGLIAFTQLHTPSWVIDYLIANTILPIWDCGDEQRSSSDLQPWNELLDDRGAYPELHTHAEIDTHREPLTHAKLDTHRQPHSHAGLDRHRHLLTHSKPHTNECRGDFPAQKRSVLPASEIRILDPCCGAGNFLFRAFDLFVAMHLAEGKDLQEAIAQTVGVNLHGADIDENAVDICKLGLALRCFSRGCIIEQPFSSIQSSQAEGLLGSLSPDWLRHRDHPLGSTFNAIVTNPPYSGRRLIDRQLKQALRELFPTNHHDLASAFVEWSLKKLEPGGRIGFITQASLLFLPSYSRLRERLLREFQIESVVDLGAGVFPLQGGEKVNSMLLVVKDPGYAAGGANGAGCGTDGVGSGAGASTTDGAGCKSGTSGIYSGSIKFVDLRAESNKSAKQLAALINGENGGRVYIREPSEFMVNERFSLAYDCPAHVSTIIAGSKKLSDTTDVRQGLATTDNGRFLRFIWDVPDQSGWIPYVKGAGNDSWYSPIKHAVKWGTDGEEIKQAVSDAYPYLNGHYAWVVKNEQYYFREGLCFSFVNTGNLAVRHLPEGCIFDVGASALFCEGQNEQWFLLGYLNSAFVKLCALALNPTINFQVGDIKRLPMLDMSQQHRAEIAACAQEIYSLVRSLHLLFDPVSAFFDPHVSTTERAQFLGLDRRNAVDSLDRLLLNLNDTLTLHNRQLQELQNSIDEIIASYIPLHINTSTRTPINPAMPIDARSHNNHQHCPYDLPIVAKARAMMETPAAFARAYLLARVMKITGDSANQGFASAPLTDEGVASLLDLSRSESTWLSTAMGKPVPSYLVRELMLDASRQFLGSSPIVALQGPPLSRQSKQVGDSHLVLATTSFIRSMLSDPKKESQQICGFGERHDLAAFLRAQFGTTLTSSARGTDMQKALRTILLCLFFAISIIAIPQADATDRIPQLTLSIEKDPSNAQLYLERANAYSSAGIYKSAIKDYDRALALSPGLDAAYSGRANARTQTGLHAKAMSDANIALKRHPKESGLWELKSWIALNLKDYKTSIDCATHALSLDAKRPVTYIPRSRSYTALKNLKNALADLNSALALDGKLAIAFQDRARLRFVLRDYRGTIADTNRLLELEPKQAHAYKLRALCHEILGDKNSAIADYSLFLGHEPHDLESLIRRGNLYASIGPFSNAVQDYTSALAIKKNDVDTLLSRAQIYTNLNEEEKAIADYDTVLKIKENSKAHSGKAKAYYHLERYADAEREYTWLIDKGYGSYEKYRQRGSCYSRLDRPAEAYKDLTEALRLQQGDDHWVRFNRANASIKLRNYTAAIADLDAVIKSKPTHARAYSLRAEAYDKLGKKEKAKQDRASAERIGEQLWGLKV